MSLTAKEVSELRTIVEGLKAYVDVAHARLSNPKIKGWTRSYKGQSLESLLEGLNWVAQDAEGSAFAFEKKPLYENEVWDVKDGNIQPLFDSLVYTGKPASSLIRVRDLLPELGLDE